MYSLKIVSSIWNTLQLWNVGWGGRCKDECIIPKYVLRSIVSMRFHCFCYMIMLSSDNVQASSQHLCTKTAALHTFTGCWHIKCSRIQCFLNSHGLQTFDAGCKYTLPRVFSEPNKGACLHFQVLGGTCSRKRYSLFSGGVQGM